MGPFPSQLSLPLTHLWCSHPSLWKTAIFFLREGCLALLCLAQPQTRAGICHLGSEGKWGGHSPLSGNALPAGGMGSFLSIWIALAEAELSCLCLPLSSSPHRAAFEPHHPTILEGEQLLWAVVGELWAGPLNPWFPFQNIRMVKSSFGLAQASSFAARVCAAFLRLP